MTLPTKRTSRANPPLPNPYSPSSPQFAERNQAHPADLGGGMVRVDIGKPAGLVRDILRDNPQAS